MLKLYSLFKRAMLSLSEPVAVHISTSLTIESSETAPKALARLSDAQRASLLTWAAPIAA